MLVKLSNRKVRPFVVILITNILLSLLLAVTIGENIVFCIEKPFIMLNLKLRGQIVPNNSIAIIDIDQKGIDSHGRWPWERGKMAKLIDLISEYNPKVIGIEILFIDRSDNINDSALSASIERVGNIILGYVKSMNVYPFNYKKDEVSAVSKFGIGFLDKVYDSTGRVVGINPFIEEQRKKHKAFAVMVAERFDTGRVQFYYKTKELLRINFYGPQNTFKHYSANAVFDRKIDSIKRKIVILSANILPVYEVTPFGKMTTAEVQANIIQNIIDNNWLRLNKFISFIFSLATGISFVYAFKNKKGCIGLLLTGAVIYLLLSYLLFLRGVIVPVSNVIVLLTFNYSFFKFFYTAPIKD